MEQKKSEAIILRTKDFGESDLIVTVFSSLFGTLKGVAKGARRSSKRFVNSLSIFSLVNLAFTERRSGDLVWIDSCELIDGFPGIRLDYNLLLKASYMVEVTETLFPLNVQSPEMFELLRFALDSVSNKRNTEEIMIIFQSRAMNIGGFGINVSKCSLCGRPYKGEGRALFHPPSGSIVCLSCEKESALTPGMDPDTVHILEQIQSHDLSLSNTLKCSEDIISELKRVLVTHIEHRLGKRLKSAKYIQPVSC
jgi:DNA repair protein RecO (recombination protein O)